MVQQPALAQPGDFLFALITSDSANSDVVGAPSNWTVACNQTDGSYGSVLWCYTHFVTASDSSSYTFTFAQQAEHSVIVADYENVNSSPFDVAPGPQLIAGVPFIAPAITTTSPNAMVLGVFFDESGTGTPWTVPSNANMVASTDWILLTDFLQATPATVGPEEVTNAAPANQGGIVFLAALVPR